MAVLLGTAAMLCTFPLHQIAASLLGTAAGFALGGPRLRSALAAYMLWAWLLDRSPQRGGYDFCWRFGITDLLRRAFFWRWAAGRLPVTMHATAPLPPSEGPYIFVCHPHGIFGISPCTHFGTDATGFSEAFPGLQVHLLGHNAIFRIPFFREWCLAHGHGSVDRRTCAHLLQQGHCIALAPGGARESLECTPGTMRLFLKERRGFAKLALQSGAALVPVLAFGENECYSTVQFEPGTWCRRLQEALQRRLGFALPLFCGTHWSPLMPKRQPISTVIGAAVRPRPLAAAAADGGSPTPSDSDGGTGSGVLAPEAVAAFHARYCDALRELFDRHKVEHGAADMELVLV